MEWVWNGMKYGKNGVNGGWENESEDYLKGEREREREGEGE